MTLALSELLGATVYDPSGAASGRVREVTLAPQEDRSRIASLIVKTKSGNRVLPFAAVSASMAECGRRPRRRLGRRERDGRTCSCWSAICSTSRSSTSTGAKWSASMMSTCRWMRRRTRTPAAHPVLRVHLGRRGRARGGPAPAARSGAQARAARLARQNSAAHHSVEFRRRDRDRSGAPREAENLARWPGQAASRRHCRHRGRSGSR